MRPGRVRFGPAHRSPVGKPAHGSARAGRRHRPPGIRGRRRRGGKQRVTTEDAAIVQFETDAGAVGSVVVSQISAGRKNRLWIELDGAEQALAFDQENPETLWCGSRDELRILRRDPATLSPPAARLAFLPGGHPQGYADCFDAFVADFYEGVRSGSAPDGMPTFSDGLRAALITDAVLASAREQRWVDVAVSQETAVDPRPVAT